MKWLSTWIISMILFFSTLSIAQDTLNIRSGWNLIGAVSTKALSQIYTEPSGIITSYYFGYSPTGYTAVDTLKWGEGYWVKASQAGIVILGSSSSFVCGTSTITYNGTTYNTVQIGTQCWFKENLDVGTMVDSLQNQTNNSIVEKYCFNDNLAYCATHGGLYQWNEAMQYSTTAGAQGICPTNWHLPTYAEFQTLGTTVSNNGNALKAIGQGGGTNTSGFSALLSGLRDENGSFRQVGYAAYIWSSTEGNATLAYCLNLSSSVSSINYYNNYKVYGNSVRCLKD